MARKADSVRYSIKDTTENSVLIIDGLNVGFQIGLGKDGSLCSSCNGDQTIIVPLIQLTISNTGGLTLSPGNKDLLCTVNGEVLRSEVNVISGSVIDIADKKFQIFEGEPKKAKRKLPQTPGVTSGTKAPPKPRRRGDDVDQKTLKQHEEYGSDGKFQGSWELIKHPEVDTEILANLKSPLELGCLAASFLTKQIHHYTDCRLSTETTDQIFKFLQEVAGYQRRILLEYLTETSEKLEEMPEAERDRPLHRPAVKLLIELLRQILDPLSHVKLCLMLLRTFSHFPSNLETLVSCQATSAILGCMAVYLEQVDVQRCSLDILAKIALYKPQLQEKLPLRETALELILRALNRYEDNIEIVQPGCRTLSTLTSNMQDVLENLLNMDGGPDVDDAVGRYINLLNHIFSESIQLVQKFLEEFNTEISVKMDGRRFLFNYSKMTQLLIKKNTRNNPRSSDNSFEEQDEISIPILEEEQTSNDIMSTTQTDTVLSKQVELLKIENENTETKGILKKEGSSNDLQDLERKVHFVDEKGESSPDYTSSEEDDDEDCKDQKMSDEDGPILEIQKTKLLSSVELSSGAFGMVEHDIDEEDNGNADELIDSQEDDHEDKNDLPIGEQRQISEENKEISHSITKTCDEELSRTLFQNENPQNTEKEGDVERNSAVVDTENLKDDVSVNCFSNEDQNSSLDFKLEESKEGTPPLTKQVSFTTTDIHFLTRTLYLVIINYANSLVSEGNDALALAIIDQPLVFLAEKCGATEGLLTFTHEHFERSKTLMDVDPTFMISVIDALRYKTLLCELLQNSIIKIVEGLGEEHGPECLTLALMALLNVVSDEKSSASVMKEEKFITRLQTSLKESEQKLQDFPEMMKLKDKVLHSQH